MPAERITLTPFGDEPVLRAPLDRPWPGRLPQPAPAVLLVDPVELLDSQGNPVRVTDRGMFTGEPARLGGAASRYRGELSWWAGPWPTGEHTSCAQVLVDGIALLLCYRQQQWYLQGAYE